MRKTYSIRKVGVGGGSSGTLKKKKRVLVSFPHSATPLPMMGMGKPRFSGALPWS